jgi:NitT/TauT family transport system substrate-binding protein
MTRRQLGFKILVSLLMIFGFVAEGETRKVKVAIPGYLTSVAFTTANEKGFYLEEGLEVEFILMGPALVVQSAIGESVDFALVGGAATTSVLRGAPLRLIYTTFYRPTYWLYSKPEIHEVRELKGKKVGVASIGAAMDSLLKEVLKRYGLEGGREVVIMGLGLDSTRYAALVSGTIDAAMLVPPYTFKVAEAGFRELVNFVNADLIDLAGGIWVREGLLQTDPALIERFVRGTLKGFLYARDNRSGTIPIIARSQKIQESLAGRVYDLFRPAMTPDGMVSEEVQRKTLEVYLKLAGMTESPPLERIFNFSSARKVRADLEAKGWRPGP